MRHGRYHRRLCLATPGRLDCAQGAPLMAMPALTLPGISWPLQATVGHIAVATPGITGHFKAGAGTDATVECELVEAGKFRNGAARQWCRTHQCVLGRQGRLGAAGRNAAGGSASVQRRAMRLEFVLVSAGVRPCQRITPAACRSGRQRRRCCIVQRQRPTLAARLLARTARAAGDRLQLRRARPVRHPCDLCRSISRRRPLQALCCGRGATSSQPWAASTAARCGHPHLDLGDFAHERAPAPLLRQLRPRRHAQRAGDGLESLAAPARIRLAHAETLATVVLNVRAQTVAPADPRQTGVL